MNKPRSRTDLATPKVTTGPLAGSRKIYAPPDAAPDLRVPLREIVLSEARRRAAAAGLRHHRPLHRQRRRDRRREGPASAPRIEWVKERGGVEEYDGRPIKPVDNGNVTGKHLARAFPNTPKPLRGARRQAGHATTNGRAPASSPRR